MNTFFCLQFEYLRESLSELVRRRARELGLSNADIAARAGLTRGYIGNIINETAPTKSGQYVPNPDTVHALSGALKVTQRDILRSVGYLTEDDPVPAELADFDLKSLPEEAIDRIREFIEFEIYRAHKKAPSESPLRLRDDLEVIEIPHGGKVESEKYDKKQLNNKNKNHR